MAGTLGEFEQVVLLALIRLGDEAYGVTVLREIERRTGRRASLGAIYTTLKRLEAKGYVAHRLGPPTPERGGRRKKFFRLQPRGARVLARSVEALTNMLEGLGREPEPLR